MAAEPSLREVYEYLYPRLVAQLFAAAGDQQEAEEAVQEAFVRAIGLGPRWADIARPEAWLRTVAVNQLRNRWRHLDVVRRMSAALPAPAAPVELSPEHVDLVAAIRNLPRDLREVVVLHYIADLQVRAVAAELDIPEGTVKWKLARARTLLGTGLRIVEEADHA